MNREELVSLRDSTRTIAVELHHVAGILGEVITRTGGPHPVRLNRPALEHFDHVSVEALLRQLRNGRSPESIEEEVKPFVVPGEPGRTDSRTLFSLINIDVFFTGAYWIGLTLHVLALFSFDCVGALLFQGVLRLYTMESANPPIHPRGSSSPIREEQPLCETSSLLNQIMGIIQKDKSMHFSSLLVSLSIQVILFAGNPYLATMIYIMRICQFLVICFLFWDNMNTMSERINQLSPVSCLWNQKHD